MNEATSPSGISEIQLWADHLPILSVFHSLFFPQASVAV